MSFIYNLFNIWKIIEKKYFLTTLMKKSVMKSTKSIRKSPVAVILQIFQSLSWIERKSKILVTMIFHPSQNLKVGHKLLHKQIYIRKLIVNSMQGNMIPLKKKREVRKKLNKRIYFWISLLRAKLYPLKRAPVNQI